MGKLRYRTDLHVHSRDVSRCANCPAETIVEKYLAAGYDALVLTNHFDPELINYAPEKTFASSVDFFMAGFHRLCRAAEGTPLHILLGMEVRFRENSNDYLVFGITEDFLRSVDDFTALGIARYAEKVHQAGLLIVQAHPFRFGMCVTNPAHLDGAEVHNGHIGHTSNNDIAHVWAEKYHLLQTSGSDHHDVSHPVTGGILTDEPIRDSGTLLRILRSSCYTCIEELEAVKARLSREQQENHKRKPNR